MAIEFCLWAIIDAIARIIKKTLRVQVGGVRHYEALSTFYADYRYSITIISIVLTVISYAALHTLLRLFTQSNCSTVYNEEQARELQLYH